MCIYYTACGRLHIAVARLRCKYVKGITRFSYWAKHSKIVNQFFRIQIQLLYVWDTA